MSSFGLVDDGTGFNKKTLSDVQNDVEQRQLADIRADLDVSADGPVGQINGTIVQEISELWDVAQAVQGARDPNNATGSALDALMAITGAFRLAATRSMFAAADSNPLTLIGTPTTVVSSGSQASVTGTGDKYNTTANATITAVGIWITVTAYVVGDRRTNVGEVYEVTIAGTSGGTGPVGTTQGVTEVDGTVTWRNLGTGTGAVDVDAESDQLGPINGNAFTVTAIETPVSGWVDVINLADETTGTNLETDEAARIRRELLLRQSGKATLEALRAAVLSVALVTEVFVFENTTLVTDGDGVPGKAFEVVAEGGTDANIRQAIFDTKPVGIEPHGTVSGVVVDSQGFSHTIKFSRPTPIAMTVTITVVTNGNYPLDGDTQVAQAIVDEGELLGIGDDVVFERIKCSAFDVSGVVDITAFTLNGGGVNVAIAVRELSDWDTGSVTVTSV
ncbi:hypothetical protein LCGC14_1716530 [marine sediment metagenome]|uniref:Baseplate protein J-like domain-containing protein n=1 Tax=marine sediment metagenome TaxID=412755 RepID=A0A0F9JU31_9ZZZZ